MQEKEIIDIYIECSSTSPREMDRQYRYLLECRSHPGNTRSGGDRLTGTYNMASLAARRELCVHVWCMYTAGMSGC